jgi:hypothetical protein
MWALVLAMSYYGGYVVLPERYNTEQACSFVGKRAVDGRRAKSFSCVNTDATERG